MKSLSMITASVIHRKFDSLISSMHMVFYSCFFPFVIRSFVALTSKNRMMGTSAKNQIITNISNTVFAFKRLLGLRFDDPLVAEEQKHLPQTLVATPEGEVGFRVWYLGEEAVLGVRQIVAMLLTKVKDIAEAALECKVFECVLAVPYFFTDAQRRALLDAAAIADIQVKYLFESLTID